MDRRTGSRLALQIFLVFVIPRAVLADTPAPPYSYAVSSQDTRFLFVMIAPVEAHEDEYYLNEIPGRLSKETRQRYPKSGLYRNQGDAIPLWTVDWYSHSVLVASDGHHVVRRGPWATNLDSEAFALIKDGKVIHSFTIGELVDTSLLLPHTVSHFEWEQGLTLNEADRTLSVSTISGERFVIDYSTGRVIASRRPLRIWLASGLLLIISLVGALAFAFRRRRRRTCKAA